MSCTKIEHYLNNEMDLIELKDHLVSCESCRIAYQVDSRIMDHSKKLNDNLVIPDLWPSIEMGLQKKKAAILEFNTRRRFILTAAATFLIIVTIWMLKSNQSEYENDRILSQQAFIEVIEAEEKYLGAIQNLEDLAYQELDKSSGQLVQLYKNKLALIDRQIENCRDALESNPASSHIRRYLMAALQDKQKTLEDILLLQG